MSARTAAVISCSAEANSSGVAAFAKAAKACPVAGLPDISRTWLSHAGYEFGSMSLRLSEKRASRIGVCRDIESQINKVTWSRSTGPVGDFAKCVFHGIRNVAYMHHFISGDCSRHHAYINFLTELFYLGNIVLQYSSRGSLPNHFIVIHAPLLLRGFIAALTSAPAL